MYSYSKALRSIESYTVASLIFFLILSNLFNHSYLPFDYILFVFIVSINYAKNINTPYLALIFGVAYDVQMDLLLGSGTLLFGFMIFAIYISEKLWGKGKLQTLAKLSTIAIGFTAITYAVAGHDLWLMLLPLLWQALFNLALALIVIAFIGSRDAISKS